MIAVLKYSPGPLLGGLGVSEGDSAVSLPGGLGPEVVHGIAGALGDGYQVKRLLLVFELVSPRLLASLGLLGLLVPLRHVFPEGSHETGPTVDLADLLLPKLVDFSGQLPC